LLEKKMIVRYGLTMLFLLLVLMGHSSLVGAGESENPPEVLLPEAVLTSAEVFELFNNRTVYSVTAVQGRESVGYYNPNGEIRQLQDGVKRTGRWRVTDNGRICLQMESLPEKCRIIVKDQGTYKKYIVKKNGDHQHSVSYPAFRDGNLLGL
jgi:hypothetical protein